MNIKKFLFIINIKHISYSIAYYKIYVKSYFIIINSIYYYCKLFILLLLLVIILRSNFIIMIKNC